MKTFFFLLSILLFSFLACNKSKDEIILKGKLLKYSDMTSDCGIFAMASVMEFEVLKITSKNYDQNSILVIVPCPELYGKNFFEKEKVYDLTLVRGNNSGTDYILMDDPKRSSLLFLEKELWATNINNN